MTPEKAHFQENLGLNLNSPEQLEKLKNDLKAKVDTLKADGSFSGEDLADLVDLLDDKTILSPTEAELKSHLETLQNLETQIDFLMALVEVGGEENKRIIENEIGGETVENISTESTHKVETFYKVKIDGKEITFKNIEKNSKENFEKILELYNTSKKFTFYENNTAKEKNNELNNFLLNIQNKSEITKIDVYEAEVLSLNLYKIASNQSEKNFKEFNDLKGIEDIDVEDDNLNFQTGLKMLIYTNINFKELSTKTIRIGQDKISGLDSESEVLRFQKKLIGRLMDLNNNEKKISINHEKGKGYYIEISENNTENKGKNTDKISKISTEKKTNINLDEIDEENKKVLLKEISYKKSEIKKFFTETNIENINLDNYEKFYSNINLEEFEQNKDKIIQLSQKGDNFKIDLQKVNPEIINKLFAESEKGLKINLDSLHFVDLEKVDAKLFIDFIEKSNLDLKNFSGLFAKYFFLTKNETEQIIDAYKYSNKEKKHLSDLFYEQNDHNEKNDIHIEIDDKDYKNGVINLEGKDFDKNIIKLNEIIKFIEQNNNEGNKYKKLISSLITEIINKKLLFFPNIVERRDVMVINIMQSKFYKAMGKNIETIKLAHQLKFPGLDLILQNTKNEIKNNKDYVDFIIDNNLLKPKSDNYNENSSILNITNNVETTEYIIHKLKNKNIKDIFNNNEFKSLIYFLNRNIDKVKDIKIIDNINKEISIDSMTVELKNRLQNFKNQKLDVKNNLKENNTELNKNFLNIFNNKLGNNGKLENNTLKISDIEIKKFSVNTLFTENGLETLTKTVLQTIKNHKNKNDIIITILDAVNQTLDELEKNNQNEKKIIYSNISSILFKQENVEGTNSKVDEILTDLNQEKENFYKIPENKGKTFDYNSFLKEKGINLGEEELNKFINLVEENEKNSQDKKAIEGAAKEAKLAANNTEAYIKFALSGESGPFEDYAARNKIALKNEFGEIINADKIKNIGDGFTYKDGLIFNQNYAIDAEKGLLKFPSGNVELSQTEQNMIKSNPETAKNIINLYSSLERVGLSKLWNFRENIFKSIENISNGRFTRQDGDYFDETETKILLNSILVSIGEKPINQSLNMEAFLSRIEEVNGRDITGTEKQINGHKDTKLENLFIEKFIPRGDILGFKQSAFEDSLKKIN